MFERYGRQLLLDDFSEESQERLANSKLALIGVGGVGSAILPLLSGMGVGAIEIFDCDKVSKTNLHRQTLYTTADISESKVECAARRCRAINGTINISAHDIRLSNKEAAMSALGDCDVVIDATDSFESRYFISSICAELGIYEILASAETYIAQCICFGEDFYLENAIGFSKEQGNLSKELAIFPPAAHLAGIFATSEAIKYLAQKKYEVGKFTYADLQKNIFKTLSLV